jgi:hypothetical protein
MKSTYELKKPPTRRKIALLLAFAVFISAFVTTPAEVGANEGGGNSTSTGTVEATLFGLDEFFVGVPVTGAVYFELKDAVFLAEIFETDFRISGLPPGLTAGAPRRVNDTLVVVPISGTPTQVNSSTAVIAIPAHLPARNILRGRQPLGISPQTFTLPPVGASAVLRQQRATFDLNPNNTAQHRDIQMQLSLNEHIIRAVAYGNYRLIEGIDFTLVTEGAFRVHTHFLRQLPVGEWPLTFEMRQGASPDFSLVIIDTRIPTPQEPQPGAELNTRLLNPPPPGDEFIFINGGQNIHLGSLGLETGRGVIRPVMQNGQASFWIRADILEYLAWLYPNAVIEARTRVGTLHFPTHLLDILRGAKAAIAAQRLEYDQVYVRITLTDESQNQQYTERVQNTFPGGQALSPLVNLTIELVRRSDQQVFFTVRELTSPLEWRLTIMPPPGIIRYGAFWFNEAPSRLEFVPHRGNGPHEAILRSIYTGTHGIINNGAILSDVPAESWGFDPAYTAAYKGLIQAVGGRLSPGTPITRAEFVQLLSFALQLPGPGFIPGFYRDVPVGHWAYDAVSRARYAGLLDGEESFRPDEPITRQEMISMTAQAITRGQPVQPPGNRPLSNYFTDYNDIATHHRLSVQTALNHGIFIGLPDNTIRPNAHATRLEAVSAAVALARVLGNID